VVTGRVPENSCRFEFENGRYKNKARVWIISFISILFNFIELLFSIRGTGNPQKFIKQLAKASPSPLLYTPEHMWLNVVNEVKLVSRIVKDDTLLQRHAHFPNTWHNKPQHSIIIILVFSKWNIPIETQNVIQRYILSPASYLLYILFHVYNQKCIIYFNIYI
jgi:hypothetical protein